MSAVAKAYRQWTPAAQQVALDRLARAANEAWRPFFCKREHCDGKPHDEWTWNHARADQHPPADLEWLTWLMLSGRGAGKTRAGAEFVHQMTAHVGRIAIVGATGADVRDVCLEGESGLLTIARPGKRPNYEPSKRRLTWPNGCVATTFSAEEPDRLRGPEHAFAWVDEACFYPMVEAVWDNLMFGLRIGARPRVVVTTTPKPRRWLKALVAMERTRVSRASTYDNLDNLAPTFAETIISRYEGTRLGRQEIHAEILDDVEGALWTWDLIEATRWPPITIDASRALVRKVVAVDPAGSQGAGSDETGIVVAGRTETDYAVLDDRSGHYSPHGWATAAHRAYEDWDADAIVAEVNYGGEMVKSQLRLAGFNDRLITVHARKGKALRAEPIVGLFEQGFAHLAGKFPELEEQLTGWVPYERGDDSPDRLDTMVYALTTLAVRPGRATLASPVDLHIETPGIIAARARHPARLT